MPTDRLVQELGSCGGRVQEAPAKKANSLPDRTHGYLPAEWSPGTRI